MDFRDVLDIRTGEYLDALFDIERARGTVSVPSGLDVNTASLHRLYADLADIASARIEGNNTTVRDALLRKDVNAGEHLRELDNLRHATQWVTENATKTPITHAFVRDLHHMVVQGLTREGDSTPGSYRAHTVAIANTSVTTSVPAAIQSDMDELLVEMNRAVPARLQIENIARCHHRFSVIHPFGNGNGRTGRLLTMAQLMRNGFGFAHHLPLTPTAVFGRDRDHYYRALAAADTQTPQGVEKWVMFVAEGIREDMIRLVALQDHDFVMDNIVEPALGTALAAGTVTARDADVVRVTVNSGVVSAGDLATVLTGSPSVRSQKLRPLIESGLLEGVTVNGRTYRAPLHRGPLVMHVMTALDKAGLLPEMVRK